MTTDIYDYIKELALLEIEYKDSEGKFNHLISYIKRMEEDRILIDSPHYKGTVYNMPVGKALGIGIHANAGINIGESTVIGKELSIISGIWISYPYNTQYIQRREYLRAPLDFEADITVFEDRDKTKTYTQKIKLRDISGKGLSYISPEPLLNYYDIECKIYLHNNKSFIFSRCEHIYSRPIKIKDENKYLNVFTFIDMKMKDIEKLVKLCFKYQLESKQK